MIGPEHSGHVRGLGLESTNLVKLPGLLGILEGVDTLWRKNKRARSVAWGEEWIRHYIFILSLV